MRLSDFILARMEPILQAWETFAASLLPAASTLDSLALRDHARQILQAIAADLRTEQSRAQQMDKSKGLAPTDLNAPETAAQTHAILRARSGFDIKQLAAEYRALRASVLRLWMDESEPLPPHLDDMIRFNEAIDQALAESVAFFSDQVDRSRNLFLGMLGHDMRSPLQTIQVTAKYLAELQAGDRVSEAATLLISSGASMKALLDDLVDFNRTRFGLGINIAPRTIDLSAVCAEKLGQLRAAYPHRRLELDCAGDVVGTWDARRLQQMLGNLAENAIRYGARDTPVQVSLRGAADEVVLTVRNTGRPIDREHLGSIFNPLTRAGGAEEAQDDTGLGLGLFIASEIAKAHGGSIEARSDEAETVFTVRLPRSSRDS